MKYKENPEFIHKKIDILVDGFLPYHNQVMPEFQLIFPGLAFFLYIRAGNRKGALEWMESINLQIESLKNLKVTSNLSR